MGGTRRTKAAAIAATITSVMDDIMMLIKAAYEFYIGRAQSNTANAAYYVYSKKAPGASRARCAFA